jgi:hypothetical protein
MRDQLFDFSSHMRGARRGRELGIHGKVVVLGDRGDLLGGCFAGSVSQVGGVVLDGEAVVGC